MSLENYTTSGNILPIGLLVCGHCKDKCLKGVDFANSQIVSCETASVMEQQAAARKRKPGAVACTSSTSDVQLPELKADLVNEVRVQPVQRKPVPGKNRFSNKRKKKVPRKSRCSV